MAAANELLRQLRTGSRFTDVAAENSFAPTATNGGRMGWVVEGSLDHKQRNAWHACMLGK